MVRQVELGELGVLLPCSNFHVYRGFLRLFYTMGVAMALLHGQLGERRAGPGQLRVQNALRAAVSRCRLSFASLATLAARLRLVLKGHVLVVSVVSSLERGRWISFGVARNKPLRVRSGVAASTARRSASAVIARGSLPGDARTDFRGTMPPRF